MIFVPLSLFAPLCLLFLIFLMVRARDMQVRSNQIFLGLVALYTVQSFLLSLRWGYDLSALRLWIGLIAPTLPACAYFAYRSLALHLRPRMMWPVLIVIANWVALLLAPDVADLFIMLTYLGFGGAILLAASKGEDATALVRLAQQNTAQKAMMLTGGALMASACADLFVLVDFVRTGGENIGLAVTLLQTGFLFVVALAASAGQSDARDEEPAATTDRAVAPCPQDDIIIADLTRLFVRDKLHQDTDLNLRRLARRLGLPDRSVSQAINRTQNMSVSQFVNGFRIKDACKLLTETDQSILQISLAAGFMTKSNFNREFVRLTGQTPSQWRAHTG